MSLCTADSKCTAETDSLCSCVDVYCCMSIAAIAVVTNSLSAVPLALLHYSKPHSTDGTPVNV